MNLIEQLGGYKKALQFLKSEKNSLEIDPVFYLDGQEILVDVLDDALLEYRRQHNIFEVGDLVVPKKGYRIGDRVGAVEKIVEDGVWVVFDTSSKMLTPAYTIEHATDAEIAAGKRLEVNQ